MRILHISTRLILGGSQENTVLSCEGQARLGHEVHLAFGPIYGPEGSLLERVERFGHDGTGAPEGRGGKGHEGRIRTHIVTHLVREVNPWADARCYFELKRLIRELRPDIVHTHSSKAGIIGRGAAWAVNREGTGKRGRAGTKCGIVHTVHGPPFMPVEGGVVGRAKTRANNLVYTLAERFAARRCHTIVSVADAMTRRFLARGIGRPGQYTTVYSGMEVEPYLHAAPGQSREEVRARLGLAPGDFVIGTVARLAQHKGHDDLLGSLGEDLRRRRDWKLLWVGDGWWREWLIARARTLGLAVAELDRSPPHLPTPSSPQVVLTGLVPPEQVPGLVRAMDVLAHPSSREGLPRTVPQALLCGVAPVAYDVDGTGEACRDGETGRLVAPGDLAGLRGAIARLAEHPEERRRMAERGREECRERFAAERMVERLESVYAAALGAAGRRDAAGAPAGVRA